VEKESQDYIHKYTDTYTNIHLLDTNKTVNLTMKCTEKAGITCDEIMAQIT